MQRERREDGADDTVTRIPFVAPTGRAAVLKRLQHGLENSWPWQLVMAFAYGASATWFLWDAFTVSSEPPPLVHVLALIGSVFIVVDVSVRVGARVLCRRFRRHA